jgi:hypothetical protein
MSVDSGTHFKNRHGGTAHYGGVRKRDTHGPPGFDPVRRGLSWSDARDGEQEQSPDIAPGAIDGGIHIVPGSIDIQLFADDIIPPRVVTALPALPDTDWEEGSLVFLTTDGKLYRNVADAWTAEVDGADILANSITAGQIAAAAIGVDELAAGSITTEKFHVSAQAPGVENSTSEVIIDSTGLTILNGKITLADYSGESVLSAAGFGGSWVDFLAGGLYNHNFAAGSGSVSSSSEVGGGSPTADYLASLSSAIPYWVVDTVSGFSALEATSGSGAPDYRVLQARLTAAGEVEIYQDAPVANGASYVLFINAESYLNTASAGSTFAFEATVEEMDFDHVSRGYGVITVVSDTFEYDVSSPYGVYEIPGLSSVGGFLRVHIRITRLSGSGTGINEFFAIRLEQQASTLRSIFDAEVGGLSIQAAGSPGGHGELRLASAVAINWGYHATLRPDGFAWIEAIGANLRFGGDVGEGFTGTEFQDAVIFGDGTTFDVSLARGAANRLDLSSGDALRISDTGQLEFGTDTLIRRVGANTLALGNDNELRSSGEAWTNATLAGTWVNVGSPWANVSYRKDAQGYVHLRGVASSGTIGTTLFTLPAGFRPAAQMRWPVNSNSAFGTVTINTSGVVTASTGSNASFFVDGITFKAA